MPAGGVTVAVVWTEECGLHGLRCRPGRLSATNESSSRAACSSSSLEAAADVPLVASGVTRICI